jgi:hypothetical protein
MSLFYQPLMMMMMMMMIDAYKAPVAREIVRLREELAPVQLCPPQIS